MKIWIMPYFERKRLGSLPALAANTMRLPQTQHMTVCSQKKLLFIEHETFYASHKMHAKVTCPCEQGFTLLTLVMNIF